MRGETRTVSFTLRLARSEHRSTRKGVRASSPAGSTCGSAAASPDVREGLQPTAGSAVGFTLVGREVLPR